MTCSGYPDGARTTPVPDLFFSRDLAGLTDPVALKTLLFVMWRVQRREKGTPPAVAVQSVSHHTTLVEAVTAGGHAGADAEETIGQVLGRLVNRHLLLDAVLPSDSGPVRWVFVNNEEGRAAHEQWHKGGVTLPGPDPVQAGVHVRPNVYTLYEQNIGSLTPMLAEELKDASDTYPNEWIEDAIRLAVENNARRWAYVRAILERWGSQGRHDAENRRSAEEDRARDSEGPYADWVRR